jgi:hypothetical protein
LIAFIPATAIIMPVRALPAVGYPLDDFLGVGRHGRAVMQQTMCSEPGSKISYFGDRDVVAPIKAIGKRRKILGMSVGGNIQVLSRHRRIIS